jgi:hypothetical protein
MNAHTHTTDWIVPVVVHTIESDSTHGSAHSRPSYRTRVGSILIRAAQVGLSYVNRLHIAHI